jgi:hypothetical protein
MPAGLDGLRAKRDRQRNLPGFGALAGRHVVYCAAIRCASTLEVPGRLPASTSACRTQLRSVSRLTPNRSATRAIAPCC